MFTNIVFVANVLFFLFGNAHSASSKHECDVLVDTNSTFYDIIGQYGWQIFFSNGTTIAHKVGTGEIAYGTYSFVYNKTLEMCTLVQVLNNNEECLSYESTNNPLGANSCQLYSDESKCVNCNEYDTRSDLRWVTFIATSFVETNDNDYYMEASINMDNYNNNNMNDSISKYGWLFSINMVGLLLLLLSLLILFKIIYFVINHWGNGWNVFLSKVSQAKEFLKIDNNNKSQCNSNVYGSI